MDAWEFLLQKKGTRSWLPLKRRRLKIEAGIYRIVAQSCRANVDVEIRVIHRTIDEIPPKRRSQKRTCRTSKEGLMVAIPFTYIRPGFWEFLCTCEKMSEIQGKPWQEVVQLEVIPAKVTQKSASESSTSPKAKKNTEKVIQEVENQSPVNQSPVNQSPVTSHQASVNQASVREEEKRRRGEEEKKERQEKSADNQQPITNNQQPITNNQQPITNNQQPITNNAHSLLEQSIQSLEKILQQVSEPESQPNPQPQKTLQTEKQDFQTETEESISPLSIATEEDLEGIKFPNDLSISLLQDHFIRRNNEPLLISGHVNSLDLTQTSILDSGFEGVLRYELRDPHGTELLLDVRQPLSDATIPLVFNYLLDIPTEYDTRLILGEVILEVFLDRGDGRAKKMVRLASQTFSITAGLDDMLAAIANPVQPEDSEEVKRLGSNISGEQENETVSVNSEFLDLTKRELESRPFEPIEQQILPPKLSLSKPKKTTKTKNINLPNFSSPPPRDSAYHSYQVSSVSSDFLNSLTKEPQQGDNSSETENAVSNSTISESDRADNSPEENPDKIEVSKLDKEKISLDISPNDRPQSEENEPSKTEYIDESDETSLEEEKKDRSFQKLPMQGRFWKQINLLKVDEEVNEELVEWLQAHPVRSPLQNTEENELKKNELEATAQRLAEKAEVLQDLAEEERHAALVDIAEELEIKEETSEVEILEKLAREAEFLKKLAAEMDNNSSEEKQEEADILRAPEIPSPNREEEAKVAEAIVDRINHEFVVDDEEDGMEEEFISGTLPKHDASGLPYPVEINNLVTSRSMLFSPSVEKNRKEMAISDIQPIFSPHKTGNLITKKQSIVPPQLREQIPVPTPILDVPDGELSGGELVLIRVRFPSYPGSIYVKLWVQDRETRQLLDGPRAFVDFTGNDAGELETLTQLIVPVGSLSIRIEAIAIDVETQKESHKAICDRTVIPPEFQQKSLEMI
ncbi:MAG: hypothetical protein AB4290_13660 [Spirulina sp.]